MDVSLYEICSNINSLITTANTISSNNNDTSALFTGFAK